ncbi:MAG: hypothetical protein KBS67_06100 [Bacteroidales bacterium]|nr:hypothetical protein [Candidatus Cryptobacteroides equifaecalis]
MKRIVLFALGAMMAFGADAQEKTNKFNWYGFIRNYAALDTRESVAGTEDFFLYVPKDVNMSGETDLNQVTSFRYAALTSRLGVNVTGYEFGGWKFGGKIEADFYAGLNGSTGVATLRLRQAFATMEKGAVSMKFGQAWHPMAADISDVISLNAGAPFGPFSRTPQATFDFALGSGFSLTASALWQMQYVSAGPKGASADYIKYGCVPEFYLGANYKDQNFLARVGLDVTTISPSRVGNKKDMLTTLSPFVYAQYKKGMFTFKGKTILAQAGEHMNLNGGYALTDIKSDGSKVYTPTRNSSSWVCFSYGKKWQGIFFAGYVQNFGTKEKVYNADVENIYFSKNSFSNMNSMWRVSPTVAYNLGKMTFALEYEMTGIRYGEWGQEDFYALATKNLHNVTNHRVQLMIKYTF